MKGGKYTTTLAKIWVEGIIRIRDIRGNVLPKFLELIVWRRHAGDLLQKRGFTPRGTHNVKVILFLILELFR